MNDTSPLEVPRIWKSALLDDLPWLVHGVTERGGGVSTVPFSSLNLGLHVGDSAEQVKENRKRVAAAAGLPLTQMVCAEQVHGSTPARTTSKDAGRGVTAFAEAIPGVDALVTNETDLLLTLFFADCLPVILADTEHRVVAVVHAGWRGLVGGVIENTLQMMEAQFGSRAEFITAALGPAIGPCCFEVGSEVATQFPSSVLHTSAECKPRVDLPGAARLRLWASGIPPHRIDSANTCTACHTQRFFSHRREQGRTGRMSAFIAKR